MNAPASIGESLSLCRRTGEGEAAKPILSTFEKMGSARLPGAAAWHLMPDTDSTASGIVANGYVDAAQPRPRQPDHGRSRPRRPCRGVSGEYLLSLRLLWTDVPDVAQLYALCDAAPRRGSAGGTRHAGQRGLSSGACPDLDAQRRDLSDAHRSPEYRSEEHTSELQSLMRRSYAVFCLKKKKKTLNRYNCRRKTHETQHDA